jgi:uncharacterized membrane protein YqiK
MSDTTLHPHGRSGAGAGFLAVLVGLVFVVCPIAFSTWVTGVAQVILVGFGVFLLLIGAIIVTITKLYVKATPYAGFIRTGMGGAKVVVDGGALVVPVIHEVAWVTFDTLCIQVMKNGKDALITNDNLRADCEAEFFVRIQKEPKHMVTASAALGDDGSNVAERKKRADVLCFSTCESALRAIAVTMTLHDLNSKREDFKDKIKSAVGQELEEKGFTLDSVAVPKLDQSPPDTERADTNMFDAQGATTIAQIVQSQKVQRNQIEKSAQQSMKEQDVATQKMIWGKEVEQKTAEAEKDLAQAKAKAEADQKAETFKADQERQSEVAQQTKTKLVEVAKVEQQQAVKVAEQLREQAEQLAAREKEITLAEAEKRRATAEAEQLEAQAKKETQAQAVIMVQIKSAAEQERQKVVIAKQAEADSKKIEQNMIADTAAYTKIKEAQAEQESAEKRASAKVQMAQATKTEKVLTAEGEKATQMVPVDVLREKVTIERQELQQKSEFAEISRGLTVELAKIEMEKTVRVALAQAMGEAMSQTKMTVWGSPETAAKMMGAFVNGQAFGNYVEGLKESVPVEVQEAALSVASGVGTAVAGLVNKLTGPVSKKPEDGTGEVITE